MTDELVSLIDGVKSGSSSDFETICAIYAPLMAAMAKSFESTGAGDSRELMLEARTALLKAALDFDVSQTHVTFGLYAKICIRNAMISQRRKALSRSRREAAALKRTHKRNRHFFQGSGSDAGSSLLRENPSVIELEAKLSPFEKKVFREYMSGRSIGEIADAVGKPKKSVNNAVFRIRQKVKGSDKKGAPNGGE